MFYPKGGRQAPAGREIGDGAPDARRESGRKSIAYKKKGRGGCNFE